MLFVYLFIYYMSYFMIENWIFFIIIKILNIVGILNIKGMGDETLIGLLHIMPKTHPLRE